MPNKPHRAKPIIHIFHNGKKAEPIYFGDFGEFLARNDAEIRVKNYPFRGNKNGAPWQVIERALEESKNIFKDDCDQIWCVFDVDDYWKQDKDKFKKSLEIADQNNIKIAYSNECFELWLLLHFHLVETAISRTDYDKKLKKFFKNLDFDYKKNSEKIFAQLLSFQKKAIQNAKKIYTHKQPNKNPSTSIFKMVEELNKFLPPFAGRHL